MILSRVSHYLRQHRRASLYDMVNGIGSTSEVIAVMLVTLERKERVRLLPAGSSCGNFCCKCNPTTLAIYEWTGEDDGDGK